MADDLARRGWASWNIEYRRVGYKANEFVPHEGAGWPGTFQDVATALDKLADVAAEVGSLDTERVVIIGHSAGGHLALWLAQAYRQMTVPLLGEGTAGRRCRIKPLAVVGQAPVADLHKEYSQKLSDDGDAAEKFMGGSPESVAGGAAYPAACPAALLPLGCAQLLVTGTDDTDVPVTFTREYAENARKAGDPVTLLEFPGAGHYELITPMDPTWVTQREAIERLLDEATGNPHLILTSPSPNPHLIFLSTEPDWCEGQAQTRASRGGRDV
jgi:acetyl esterase/lipase